MIFIKRLQKYSVILHLVISKSNYHNPKLWSAEKEMIMQTVRYMFPYLNWVSSASTLHHTLKEGSKIMYRTSNGQIAYGIVKFIAEQEGTLEICLLKFPKAHMTHNCFRLLLGVELPKISIPFHNYMGQILVTKGYINRFVCH
jgi:hypothetical protein